MGKHRPGTWLIEVTSPSGLQRTLVADGVAWTDPEHDPASGYYADPFHDPHFRNMALMLAKDTGEMVRRLAAGDGWLPEVIAAIEDADGDLMKLWDLVKATGA